MLTGDDVRPGDAGYDFEVPPKGLHVKYLTQLLTLLEVYKPVEQPEGSEEVPDAETWWDQSRADGWAIIQKAHHADMSDGVVERTILEEVLVKPVGFMVLKSRIEDEKDAGAVLFEDNQRRMSSMVKIEVKKPSMEQLCKRLSMSMSRMIWLHQLFESYLTPGGNDTLVACFYPGPSEHVKERNDVSYN